MAEEIIRREIEKRFGGRSTDERERFINLVKELVEISTASVPDKKGRCRRLVLDFIRGGSGESRGYSR